MWELAVASEEAVQARTTTLPPDVTQLRTRFSKEQTDQRDLNPETAFQYIVHINGYSAEYLTPVEDTRPLCSTVATNCPVSVRKGVVHTEGVFSNVSVRQSP